MLARFPRERAAMAELINEIRAVADRYPERKSAVIPALRLAQEHYGYLTSEAFREVAAALGTTPAYCRGIASFYDMFELEPAGAHTIEICTNASCALVGAAQVLEAFERELGITAGETTPDGRVTLRSAEQGDLRALEDYRRAGGYASLEQARKLGGAKIIAEIKESGIRGRGGAGFPMGQKASFIPAPDKTAKPIYLVVNADESEPGAFKDREIIERVPHRLIEGMQIAALAIQAEACFIYIRGEYLTGSEIFAAALVEAEAAGLVSIPI